MPGYQSQETTMIELIFDASNNFDSVLLRSLTKKELDQSTWNTLVFVKNRSINLLCVDI